MTVPLSKAETQALLPVKFFRKLYTFQQETYHFAVSVCLGRALLALGPGLGKSPTALAIYWALLVLSRQQASWADAGMLLVLCEASKVAEWVSEIEKWIGIPKKEIYWSGCKQPQRLDTCRAAVMTYDALRKNLGRVRTKGPPPFGTLIADESHRIKSQTALRTKNTAAVASGCQYVLLLTGTPITRCVSDMYAPLHIIRPDLFPSFEAFTNSYCVARQGRAKGSRFFVNSKRVEELYTLLSSQVMVRVREQDVEDQLAARGALKTMSRTEIPLEPVSEEHLEALTEAHRIYEEEKVTLPQQFQGGQLDAELGRSYGNLHRAVAKYKAPSAVQWLEEHLVEWLKCKTNKIVLFAHHKRFLRQLIDLVSRLGGVRYIHGDGSVPSEQRPVLLQPFQQGKARVAILALEAFGTGINLTAANIVVTCELPFNGSVLAQAERRCLRIGQKQNVQAFALVMNCEHEKRLWSSLKQKLVTAARVLDNERTHETCHYVKATTAAAAPRRGTLPARTGGGGGAEATAAARGKRPSSSSSSTGSKRRKVL